MIGLALTLARGGNRAGAVLVAGCVSVVTALLLVVITLALLPSAPAELLSDLELDPNVRIGTAFAIVLLTLPPLLLLDQAVRLGTAARERRLAALRVAGATPREVRRLGGLEVGLPAFAGAVLGIVLYLLLRVFLGGSPDRTLTQLAPVRTLGTIGGNVSLALVPTSVSPAWWQLLLTVGAVTLLGVVVGARAAARVGVTPHGATRHQVARAPRAWGVLLLLVDAVAAWLYLSSAPPSDALSTVAGVALVATAVLGIVSLAPWAAYRAGRYAEARAISAPMLLAARRLVSDPRPAGRAAAAVGGIAMVSGGAGVLGVDFVLSSPDPAVRVSLVLVFVALFGALLVATGSLAVHSVESMHDRRRSIACLSALGVTAEELEATQRCEALLVTLPIGVAGTLLGTIAVGMLAVSDLGVWVLLAVPNLVITPALVWLAVVIATSGTRRWALRAAAPGNLRTE